MTDSLRELHWGFSFELRDVPPSSILFLIHFRDLDVVGLQVDAILSDHGQLYRVLDFKSGILGVDFRNSSQESSMGAVCVGLSGFPCILFSSDESSCEETKN